MFTERQNEIINAALDIISSEGIGSLTVKNIGKKLNISDAALYKHFKNKNQIFLGIAKMFENESNRVLKDIINSDLNCIYKIKAFYMNRIKGFLKNKSTTIVLFSEEIINDKKFTEKISAIMKNHKKILMEEIKRGQKNNKIKDDYSPEHIFTIIMGALRIIVQKWRLYKFKFNLIKKGEELWETLEKIIKK